MGTVYEAWQRSLQRVVALKVLAPHISSSPKAIIRFQREAQAAAKLHHTHIVPIFAQGEADGNYFYAMEFVSGEGLNAIIAGYRQKNNLDPAPDVAETVVLHRGSGATASSAQPTGSATEVSASPVSASGSGLAIIGRLPYGSIEFYREVAEHVAAVADALEYAHQMGVIHRDIKPHNLIQGADGRLRISDFGLARLAEQPGVTVTGEMVGSPLYMSPEQISGDFGSVDHRADIYSLGATLYEWLTLRPPYPGETREQVISRILSSEASPVRSLTPTIPLDLETIAMKAVERDPARRYRSAAELRDDLRRYLARQPIQARRPGLGQRSMKFVRRHQIAVLASVSIVIAGALIWAVRASQQQVDTERAAAIDATAAAAEVAQTNELLTGFIAMLQANPVTIAEAATSVVEGMVGRDATPAQGPLPPGTAAAPSVGTPASIALALGREILSSPSLIQDESEAESNTSVDFARAVEYWQAGLWQEAKDVLEPHLSNHASDFIWHELYLGVCTQLRRYEDVLSAAEPFLQTPHAGRAAIWRGLAGLMLNRYEETAMELGRAGLDAAQLTWVRVLRGLLWIQASNYAEALRDLDAAIADAPNLSPAHLARAHALVSTNRVAEALEEATRVLELNPRNPDALTIRGDCHLQLADFAAAERDYREAMEIAGRTPSLVAKWGAVYLQKSQTHRNATDPSTSLKNLPGNPSPTPSHEPDARRLAPGRLGEPRLRDNHIALPSWALWR